MKIFLLVLFLLGIALPHAFSQAWVAPPGAPVYDSGVMFSGFDYGASSYLSAPQPNALWGVMANGYPQGGTGSRRIGYTAFCTSDGGQTWQTLRTYYNYGRSDSGESIEDLSAIDGQRAWLLKYNVSLSSYVLMRTTSGMAGFASVAGVPSSVRKIHFFSATVGIGVGSQAAGASSWPLYRTTDGGNSWTLIANTLVGGNSVDNVRTKHSYGNSLWLTTRNNTVLQTADAGLTWTATPNLGDVAFSDTLHGLAYTNLPYTIAPPSGGVSLLRTADGGASWTTLPPTMTASDSWGALTALRGTPGAYVSMGGKWVGSSYTTSLYISRDAGTSWQIVPTSGIVGHCLTFDSASQLWGTVFSGSNAPMVLRLGGVVLAARQPSSQTDILAYPNPSTGIVEVSGPLAGQEQVRIYDAAGRLCQQGQVSGAQRTIDLSAQAPGLYQLILTAADGTVRRQRLSKI